MSTPSYFQAIYVFIWQRLTTLRRQFVMFGDKMFFLRGKVGFDNKRMTLQFPNEKGEIRRIADLERYIRDRAQQKDHGDDGICSQVDDFDDFLTRELEKYLECQIKESGLYIPSNFAHFVEKQKPKWIANAVEALNYQENVHYIVHKGQVKPVDFNSTGIVQSSTVWSDGLHQFLQLKHNLEVTSETLTTNFLSNVGFVNKYERIYGLSGTLGSKAARTILKDVYKVDVVDVPSRREKQFFELKSAVTVAESEERWLREVLSSLVLEVKKGRGCLVICETIEQANLIHEKLKRRMRAGALKLYTMNGMDQEKHVDNISPGEVIIATNLAGRGTDIRTDKIEVTGGLHVIITFLPNNQRVEDQAFGRTARQGKRGTGALILNASAEQGSSNDDVKAERDKAESLQLEQFRDKELRLIQVKDKLFDKFCSFLNDKVRVKIRQDTYSNWRKLKNLFTELLPTTYETSVLAAVEEQWAEFLGKIDEGVIGCRDAEAECDKLIERLQNDFAKGELIKNPYYLISIANNILADEWGKKVLRYSSGNIKKALSHFEKAIRLEDDFRKHLKTKESSKSEDQDEDDRVGNNDVHCPGAAHVGVAWCLLLLQKDLDSQYKERSLKSLKSALDCLSNDMSVLGASRQTLRQTQLDFEDSDLDKQFDTKSTILGSYINGVNSGIEAIKSSKRLIDLVTESIATPDDDKQRSRRLFRRYREQEKAESGKTFKNEDLSLDDDNRYSVTFNHLTHRYDSGDIDQAVNTLSNAFGKLSDGYKGVQVHMMRVDMAKVNASLFQTDKEFNDLSRESAIAKIKAERSYWNVLRITSSFQADLTVKKVDEKGAINVYENMQLNALLDIVENDKLDESRRYDIRIKKANENELSKMFKSSGRSKSFKLNMALGQLEQKAAIDELEKVRARTCDVEFVLDKSSLCKLIVARKDLKFGTLNTNCNDKNKRNNYCQIFEQVDRKTLLNQLNKRSKAKESPCFIRFDDLSLEEAKAIVKGCGENSKVAFVLHFRDIYDFRGSGINEGRADYFSFDEMDKEAAEMVIHVLRAFNFHFTLEFKDLSCKEVQHVVKHADLTQEDMKIMDVKNISDMYKSDSTPNRELDEFVSKGMEFILEINENLFVPWWSVCAVAGLATIQVLAGAGLIVTGFGASVGMGLITEGVADAFTAYRAFSTRQFRWNDYVSQKAVSIAISAATAGYAKVKKSLHDAAKGVSSMTAGGIQKAGEQVLSQGQTVSQTLTATGQNLSGLAWKFVAVKGSEALARETLNSGVRLLSDYSFSLLKPCIVDQVQSTVRNSFLNNGDLRRLLFKMQAIDLAVGSSQLKSRIDVIVSDTINPRHDFMQKQWDAIGLPLLKGLLADSGRYAGVATMTIRLIGTLAGLKEVITLTNKVADELLKKLEATDKNTMTVSIILFTQMKINSDHAKAIAKKLKSHEIFGNNDELLKFEGNDILNRRIQGFTDSWEREDDEDLTGVAKEDVEKSLNFVRRVYEKFSKIEPSSFSMITKSVTNKIAEQLVRVMNSQLLQPWSTYAVSAVTAKASQRIQHHLVDQGQNSESHKADQQKYDELSSKEAEDLTKEERAFMTSYGRYRTFAEQISYNRNDYCIAYSQAEMVYYSSSSSSGSSSDDRVAEAADLVRNGGAADLATMMAAAKAKGINLKVVDSKDYVKTEEEKANNVQVVFVEYSADDKLPGHAYYMDAGSGKFVEAKTVGLDCFYGALGHILQQQDGGELKSVQELRSETARTIESNGPNYLKAFAAQRWIREENPEAAHRLTFVAGLRRVYEYDDNGKVKLDEHGRKIFELVVEEGDADEMVTQLDKDETGRKGSHKEKDKILVR